MAATSSPHRFRRRLGHLAAFVAVVLASSGVTYTLFARGYGEGWNASGEELVATLPGDALITDVSTPMTRAITIDAPPEQVWPWIVQFGQGRGGLYSYDWLENLAGCDIHSLDRVDPSLQRLAVGDRVFITPDGYPADLGMVVDQIVPERALVLRLSTTKQPFAREETPWTWSFVLLPTDDGGTRLISRERYRSGGAVGDGISRALVGPLDTVMSRRMLTGIAERAEQAAGTGDGPSNAETIWFAGVLVSVVALAASLASRLPFRIRLAVAAGGAAALTLVVFRFWNPWASWMLAVASIALAAIAWRRPEPAAADRAGSASEAGERPGVAVSS